MKAWLQYRLAELERRVVNRRDSTSTLVLVECTLPFLVLLWAMQMFAASDPQLAQLYRDAGLTPQQGLRLRGTDAEERGLPSAPAAEVLAAMQAQPILIERPLVETDKGVRLCRPQDKVLEIL